MNSPYHSNPPLFPRFSPLQEMKGKKAEFCSAPRRGQGGGKSYLLH